MSFFIGRQKLRASQAPNLAKLFSLILLSFCVRMSAIPISCSDYSNQILHATCVYWKYVLRVHFRWYFESRMFTISPSRCPESNLYIRISINQLLFFENLNFVMIFVPYSYPKQLLRVTYNVKPTNLPLFSCSCCEFMNSNLVSFLKCFTFSLHESGFMELI